MRIATWNVNSLKVRQQHVIDWLASSGADVLCLQELKLTDDKFPRAELAAAGYKSWFAGQKTYNGVAILVRDTLTVDETTVVRNIPAFEDQQQRVIAATVEGVRIARRASALPIEKAQRELGYAPRPVDSVLRETIAHMMDVPLSRILKHA